MRAAAYRPDQVLSQRRFCLRGAGGTIRDANLQNVRRRPQGAPMKKLLVLLILVAIGVAVARKVREA
jgi:hypothetical protein